jgi:hypothetical protein
MRVILRPPELHAAGEQNEGYSASPTELHAVGERNNPQ